MRLNYHIINQLSLKLYNQLITWGVNQDNLKVENKDSERFCRKIIFAEKAGISLRVLLYFRAIDIDDGVLNNRPVGSNMGSSYRFQNRFHLIFDTNESSDLQLIVKKRSMAQRLFPFLSKRSPIYHPDFDKQFTIKSNHQYLHAELFDEQIVQTLLFNKYLFQLLSIRNNEVRYQHSFDYDFFVLHPNYFLDIVQVGWQLCKNFQNLPNHF